MPKINNVKKVKVLNQDLNQTEKLRQDQRRMLDPTLGQKNQIQQQAEKNQTSPEAFKKADETKQQFQERFQNSAPADRNLTATEINQKNQASAKLQAGEQAQREAIANIPDNQLTPNLGELIPQQVINHSGVAKDFLQGINNLNQNLYDAIYATILTTARLPIINTLNPITHLESNLGELKKNVDSALKDYQSGKGSYADVSTALFQYAEASRKLGDYAHLVNKSALSRYSEGGQGIEIEYAQTQKFIDDNLKALTTEATARVNAGIGA